MKEVSVTDMMQAREHRAAIQKQLLEAYGVPLICFTLNIPGPVKVFDGVEDAFLTGCNRIEAALRERHIPINAKKTTEAATGLTAFYCVGAEAGEVKRRMVALEDQDSLGRIFDLDVITPTFKKLSREDFGLPARQCMLCVRPAHECSRSRAHSVEELLCHIRPILDAIRENSL